MSYRLIDANTIAESYPEVNDMPCIYADIDGGLDGRHYDLRGASTLQAENAKLRGERDMYRYLVSWMVHPNTPDQLSAENAKLRELVRDMYEMAYPEYPSAFDAAFADRMRELGIEVTT